MKKVTLFTLFTLITFVSLNSLSLAKAGECGKKVYYKTKCTQKVYYKPVVVYKKIHAKKCQKVPVYHNTHYKAYKKRSRSKGYSKSGLGVKFNLGFALGYQNTRANW